MGTLYARFGEYIYPQLFKQEPADPEKLKTLQEALEFFNIFLEGQNFVVGDGLTIADLALVATVSTIEISRIDLTPYANITRWFENMKKVAPGYDLNVAGLEAGIKKYASKMKQ